jgi:ABC-type uncharacterized transport system substrate-binding protein
MIRPIWDLLPLAFASLGAGTARAHPHVWVTTSGELIYAADGSVIHIRHASTFDDAFSVYATQGLASKQRGMFTREELTLAEVNVTSLKEYGFLAYAKADGKKTPFLEPADYYLDYDPKHTVLSLHFTLPFKTPVKAKQLNVEIYDPSAFIDFAFAEKDSVALVGSPATCRLAIVRPGNATIQSRRLSQTFFDSPDASGWARQFANRVQVKCP